MWVTIVLTSLIGLIVTGAISFNEPALQRLRWLVTPKIDLPEDANCWFDPDYGAPNGIWFFLLPLALLATLVVASIAVLDGGFRAPDDILGAILGGVADAFAAVVLGGGAFGLGGVIGYQSTKLRGDISPLLVELATQAEQRALRFEADGDTERAAAAQRLADWTKNLSENVPNLTAAVFERYYTPYQVADILDGWFFGGGDEYEIEGWLSTTNEMLYDDPSEARRVELLNEVQNADEIRGWLRGPQGPVRMGRVREMIDRLEALAGLPDDLRVRVWAIDKDGHLDRFRNIREAEDCLREWIDVSGSEYVVIDEDAYLYSCPLAANSTHGYQFVKSDTRDPDALDALEGIESGHVLPPDRLDLVRRNAPAAEHSA